MKRSLRNTSPISKACCIFSPTIPQVPKEAECANLLVPVCLSSWHVAYGSIRMEPVFMILGQSAGAAASIAITDKVPVQKVDYNKLKDRLRVGKQLL